MQGQYAAEYETTLFGYAQGRANQAKYVNSSVAAGSTLATGYLSNAKSVNSLFKSDSGTAT